MLRKQAELGQGAFCGVLAGHDVMIGGKYYQQCSNVNDMGLFSIPGASSLPFVHPRKALCLSRLLRSTYHR